MNIKDWIEGMELEQLKDKLKAKKDDKEIEPLTEEDRVAVKQRICKLSDMDRRKVFCPVINRGCIVTCECYVRAFFYATRGEMYPGYCSNFMLTGVQ